MLVAYSPVVQDWSFAIKGGRRRACLAGIHDESKQNDVNGVACARTHRVGVKQGWVGGGEESIIFT